MQGDGPIALIMAPTRELIVQIGKDVNRFAKSTGFRCVCVYGGTGVGSQVSCMHMLADEGAPESAAWWLAVRSRC